MATEVWIIQQPAVMGSACYVLGAHGVSWGHMRGRGVLGTHVGTEQVSAGGTVTPETTGGGAALPRFEEKILQKERIKRGAGVLRNR